VTTIEVDNLQQEVKQLKAIIMAQDTALAAQARAIFDLQANIVKISGTLMAEVNDLKEKLR
jgi:hypothetical protein